MTKLDRYCVFGHPIKHTKSPIIHQQFGQQTGQNIEYSSQDVDAGQFETAANIFFADGGKGLNCTVPLKELAWNFADTLTDRAQYSKAVNTLAQQADGSLLGDNTDGIGLVTDLVNNHQIKLDNINILLLGAGGASRGILQPILQRHPKRLVIANRTITKAINMAKEFSDLGTIEGCGFDDLESLSFDLILNATSASLSGQLPPLAKGLLAKNGLCYDLAYGNEPTAFVRWGKQQGAIKSLDGLGMLVEQAAEAFYIWRGVHPETQAVIAKLDKSRKT